MKSKVSEKKPEDEIVQLQKEYHATFNSKAGKVVLDDLERRNWIRTPTIADLLHVMAFREGQRSVLLYIRTMMDMDPNEIREMIKEIEKLQNLDPVL